MSNKFLEAHTLLLLLAYDRTGKNVQGLLPGTEKDSRCDCDVSKTEDREEWVFTSNTRNALRVTLYWWKRGGSFVGLEVEDVDCGYWHTAEEENIDYHIELAKAALMGRIGYNRSPIFRLKEVCFKLDGKWECTLTDSAGSYHYIKTRKKIKHPVGVACLVCSNITITEHGSFEICPVCFWEDDGEYDDPSEVRGGPNGDLSLEEARRNYSTFGAVEKRFIKEVRPPTPSESA